MTIEMIQTRIADLKAEQSLLQQQHDQLNKKANEFQEAYRVQAGNNLNRFQQLKGSIETLESLLNEPNGETNADTTGN